MKHTIVALSLLIGLSVSIKAQKKDDTIKNLTSYSVRYLDALYNQRNLDSIISFWSRHVYDDLAGGYNNGGIAYSSEKDLATLFKKDISSFLKEEENPVMFRQNGKVMMFSGDDDELFFLITFDLKFDASVDTALQSTSLDFISKDQGKTWKINNDHWIQAFMYYLYRRNHN